MNLKNDLDKFQYDERDITSSGEFDVADYSDLSSAEISKITLELTKFILEKDLTEYSDFIDKIIELDNQDYFLIASNNVEYFNNFLRSRRNSKR